MCAGWGDLYTTIWRAPAEAFGCSCQIVQGCIIYPHTHNSAAEDDGCRGMIKGEELIRLMYLHIHFNGYLFFVCVCLPTLFSHRVILFMGKKIKSPWASPLLRVIALSIVVKRWRRRRGHLLSPRTMSSFSGGSICKWDGLLWLTFVNDISRFNTPLFTLMKLYANEETGRNLTFVRWNRKKKEEPCCGLKATVSFFVFFFPGFLMRRNRTMSCDPPRCIEIDYMEPYLCGPPLLFLYIIVYTRCPIYL